MKIKNLAVSALFCALICTFSIITLPIAPVPFTITLFIISLSSYLMPLSYSLLSVLSYILIGAVGIPVFSGFRGGFHILTGATGGFIWGYIFVCLFIGISKNKTKKIPKILFGISGILLCYILGILQLCFVSGTSFLNGFSLGFLPLFIKDSALLITAFFVSEKLSKKLNLKFFQ